MALIPRCRVGSGEALMAGVQQVELGMGMEVRGLRQQPPPAIWVMGQMQQP